MQTTFCRTKEPHVVFEIRSDGKWTVFSCFTCDHSWVGQDKEAILQEYLTHHEEVHNNCLAKITLM